MYTMKKSLNRISAKSRKSKIKCVRTNLIVNIPPVDGLGIAGHIEWFDLINGTIQAFLIVPQYHLLGAVKDAPGVLKERTHRSFVISAALFAGFAFVVPALCRAAPFILCSLMQIPRARVPMRMLSPLVCYVLSRS